MKQVLIAVLALALFGCYSPTATVESTKENQSDQDKAIEKYHFEMIYLSWRGGGTYLVKFDGHEYLKVGEHFTHTLSCPGLHGETR